MSLYCLYTGSMFSICGQIPIDHIWSAQFWQTGIRIMKVGEEPVCY
jgi:hypothetical protein